MRFMLVAVCVCVCVPHSVQGLVAWCGTLGVLEQCSIGQEGVAWNCKEVIVGWLQSTAIQMIVKACTLYGSHWHSRRSHTLQWSQVTAVAKTGMHPIPPTP